VTELKRGKGVGVKKEIRGKIESMNQECKNRNGLLNMTPPRIVVFGKKEFGGHRGMDEWGGGMVCRLTVQYGGGGITGELLTAIKTMTSVRREGALSLSRDGEKGVLGPSGSSVTAREGGIYRGG